MNINDLLKEKNISKYRLVKESGVPQATISDICTGKSRIEKCSGETLYKIAKVLDVSIESLIEEAMQKDKEPHRCSFEVFKSNVCHLVKDKGDIDFIIDVLTDGDIRKLYERKWHIEAYYLLAMVDYLSRINDIPICTDYSDIRAQKLKERVYPTGVLLADEILKKDTKEKALESAIPEFLNFNIVESEVRDVC